MKKCFLIYLLLSVTLCGCSLNGSVNTGGTFLVNDAQNNVLGELSVSGNDITVTDPKGSLTGVKKREDKRKYYAGSDVMEYAVKYSDDGFKLRDSNEKMIWKIKLYEDKIKISDNEEMYNAYEIKLREAGKLKVERDDRGLYELHLSEGEGWNKIENKYSVKGFGLSVAPGVLLITEMKEREKLIVMAELAAMKR